MSVLDLARSDVGSIANDGRPQWHDLIPISVNDTYGDPFIPEQVDNTVQKLQILMDHKAPIAIFTKAGWDPAVLEKLSAVRRHPKVVVFYSLTNLNEGGISFENRVAMIEALEQTFRFVVVFTRPIIPNRNDDDVTLQKLVDVAATHSKLLVMGGVHNYYKNKRFTPQVEATLTDMCDRAGVKCFQKTSCAAAYFHGVSCWMHELGVPLNLDVAAALGYTFSIDGDRLVLDEASTGDINFLRMLTRAEIYAHRIISNYNLLTAAFGEQKYEATSSWFAWSENIETCLDCDYCIIKQIEYLKKMRVKIGTHPREMLGIVAANSRGQDFAQFHRTKLKSEWIENAHSYNDVRIPRPCFTKRYAPLANVSVSVSPR